jgi:beta-lactamase superfamily II metal-dependent hydrolase
LIIYYFQQIAWVSPLANLLFFIPAEIIIIGGLLGEGIALMLPWLGRLILLLVDCNLSVIRWIAHFLASKSWSASWSPVWPWPWMVGFYLGLFLVLDSIRPNLFTKKRQLNSGLMIIILLAVLNLVVWTSFFQLKQGRCLQLTAIDVGQGDSLFVETPDNFKLLIDGGNVGKGISRVIPFLRSIGVDRLDLVIATHGDSDHICGLAEVLEEIPAQKFLLPMKTDGTNVKNILRRLQPYHIKYLPAFTGEQLKLGADINGEILADPGAVDENDRSWVVVFKYGKNKLLLTGDLSKEGETVLARQYPAILRASVLKVGHHGSNYASGLNFISQIKPKVAIISVGAGNHYGHPGPFTINRLRSLGIDIYRTDRWGSVTVKLYRDRFTVGTSK